MATALEFDPQASCGSSRAVDEPVAATATHAFAWIALEVPKPWGRKALRESDLPQSVKDHLDRAADTMEGGRVLFITRDDRRDPEPLHLYLARSREAGSTLRRLELDSYEDLLDIDLARAMEGTGPSAGQPLDESLFLCCTNGKRDACCARLGLDAYNALVDLAPGRVWQSSHQGGHRFAANLIVLPEGLHYGRIEGDRAADVLQAHARGQILLPFYRGRTLYDSPVQAAEHFLRVERQVSDIGATRLESVERIGGGAVEVQMRLSTGPESWRVRVEQSQSDYQVFKTTGDEQRAHVVLHRVVEAEPA